MTRGTTRVTRRPRRTIAVIVTAIVVVLLAATAWLIYRGLQVKGDLESAVRSAGSLQHAIGAGDLDAAHGAVGRLARQSAAAASVSSDPVWRAAEVLPWVGDNLAAVRVSAEQLHTLTDDVATPVLELGQRLMGGASSSKALLDVSALAASRSTLVRAADAVQDASQQLRRFDDASLIGPVADGVDRLSQVVDRAAPIVQALAESSEVVPGMLGAHGPRTILVMLQNNAELRTGGGITGTFVEVRAENGRLRITAQSDSSDFPRRDSDIVQIPESTKKLYGDVAGRYVQDTSITPDFALTARLASAWWRSYTGRTPDAVVSVDPIVLQTLLRVTGPVEAGPLRISADNMIDALLVKPYLTLSAPAQTKQFAQVVRSVFAALTTGGGSPLDLAKSLAGPVADGRVSVWSAHADEERIIGASTLAGPAARQRDAGRQSYAVYFNDTTGGKMGTFLDVSIASGVGACRSDDKRTVEVAVTLKNSAPKNAGTAFPELMTGGSHYGIPAGHIGTTVAVSAPSDAFIGGVTADGPAVAQTDAVDAGFPVSAFSVDLAPGASTTLVFRFDTSRMSDFTPTILHTPLVKRAQITTDRTVSCG